MTHYILVGNDSYACGIDDAVAATTIFEEVDCVKCRMAVESRLTGKNDTVVRFAERAYETIRKSFPGSMGGYGKWDTLDDWTRNNIISHWKEE